MRGDYTEVSVRRETVQDGSGGELEGIVIRVWGEGDTYDEDRGEILIAELRVPNHSPTPPAFPPARELIDDVLRCLELDA